MRVDETNSTKDSLYNIIMGADLMEDVGIDLHFGTGKIVWDRYEVQMKCHSEWLTRQCVEWSNLHTDYPLLQQQQERQQKILDAENSKVDIDTMVEELDVTVETKAKLKETLKKFRVLFGGELGLLNIKPVTIKLQQSAKAYKGRYYSIHKAFEAPMWTEIDQLRSIDVLEWFSHDCDSPWALLVFAQPKKTQHIRLLTDLQKVNTAIGKKLFPLPWIGKTIQRLEKFKSATALE